MAKHQLAETGPVDGSAAGRISGKTAEKAKRRTRDRILDAAIALFAARGFEGVSLQDIADRADVRRSLILYHFTSKDELWKSAATFVIERFNAEVRQRLAKMEHLPAEEFRSLARDAWASLYMDMPEVSQFLVREGGESSERLNWLVQEVGFAGLTPEMLHKYLDGRDRIRSIAIATFTIAMVALAPLVEAKLQTLPGYQPTDDFRDEMLQVLKSVR